METSPQERQPSTPARLTPEIARGLFDAMEAAPEPDFSLIEKHYREDVRFQDPIQTLEGREAFIEMTRHLVERCSELRAQVHYAAGSPEVIFLQWTMEMKIGPTPLTPIEGATRLVLDEDGRVKEHRDYFDFWGDSLAAIPGLGAAYRRFMRLLG